MDGRTFRLPPARALAVDVATLAEKVPTFPVERWFDLTALSEARSNASTRISWVTLFVKTYGLASREIPQLRTHYAKYPLPRFYENPHSVVTVSINRMHDGCDRLFWGRFHQPEEMKLAELQRQLDQYCHGDVSKIFKRQLLAARMPTWLRRAGWWWRLNWQPRQRPRRLGTASMSVLAGKGVYNRLHPCILTSTLSYGPITPDGRMWVTLQCDHRTLDGMAAADALNQLEVALNGEVLRELRSLQNENQRSVA